MVREINKVGVVGLGTMGAGIAEVFARNGLEVVGFEVTAEGLERGRGHVEQSTARALKRGKLSEEARDQLLGQITFTTEWTAFSDCDIVIEAVPERMELKHDVFTKLDAVAKPDAILATNTSSLSVTEISVVTSNPRRVVGMHFFNPAPVLKLVEVVKTVVTEEEVVETVIELAKRLGKMPVVIGDKAGFIANALLFGYLDHAVLLYQSHYATREDIEPRSTLLDTLRQPPRRDRPEAGLRPRELRRLHRDRRRRRRSTPAPRWPSPARARRSRPWRASTPARRASPTPSTRTTA